jgi:DNA-binding MarR family transcriptional regulator
MAALVTLDEGEQLDFVYLRKMLNLSDGNLGSHLSKLEDAGYIKIEKNFIKRKPRTFIQTTGKGCDAFNEHTTALRKLINKRS